MNIGIGDRIHITVDLLTIIVELADVAVVKDVVFVNGILKEAPCGGEVCTQFKGVFFRNLLLLYRARPAADIQAYMRRNSDQIWNVSRNDNNQFGYEWHLSFDGPSVMRQGSAIDALIAAYAASNPLLP